MAKREELPGLALRIRTYRDAADVLWITASVLIDGELREMARVREQMVHGPGDPLYQGWIDAVSALYRQFLGDATGAHGITSKRRRPNYEGE